MIALIQTPMDFLRALYPADIDPGLLNARYHQMLACLRDSVRRRQYHSFSVPKSNGQTRRITAPGSFLKRLQRGILPLLQAGEVDAAATAYLPGSSVGKNALPHLGAPLVVKTDIRDFFGSLRQKQVFFAIDRALEASPLVGPGAPGSRCYNRALSDCLTRLCCLDGVLPQGAPTSPLLSNLILLPADRSISAYCARHAIAYTRYCDDMTFSGTAFSPGRLLAFLRMLLPVYGLSLNEEKTRILGSGSRHIVTGVCVHQVLQAPASYRRDIRQELYYLKRFGVEEHLRRRAGAETAAPFQPILPSVCLRYLDQLEGRIAFVLSLRPDDPHAQGYRRDLRQIRSSYLQICRGG